MIQVASSRSLVKLRYVAVVDNDTAAKESRIKLTISGFTYFFTPDIAWIADAGLFAKAPDGVGQLFCCFCAVLMTMQAFESVIPSERTKISIKAMDGSFHAMGPSNPGALVAYIGELDLSTDLVGDSLETVITANVLKSNAFFIDDKSTSTMLTETDTIPRSSVEYWKVCRCHNSEPVHFYLSTLLQQLDYALLAEVDDIVVSLRHTNELPNNTQVRPKNVSMLCCFSYLFPDSRRWYEAEITRLCRHAPSLRLFCI